MPWPAVGAPLDFPAHMYILLSRAQKCYGGCFFGALGCSGGDLLGLFLASRLCVGSGVCSFGFVWGLAHRSSHQEGAKISPSPCTPMHPMGPASSNKNLQARSRGHQALKMLEQQHVFCKLMLLKGLKQQHLQQQQRMEKSGRVTGE